MARRLVDVGVKGRADYLIGATDSGLGLETSRVTVDSLAAQIGDSITLNDTIAGVLEIGVNAPPGSPADGDAYIVGGTPTGAFAGKTNNRAVWNATAGAWQFTAPTKYARVYNEDDGRDYNFNGVSWELVSDIATAFAQTIGATTTPVSAPASNLNQWFVLGAQIVGDGTIVSIRAYMANAGRIYVARFTKSGAVFTQVDGYTPVWLNTVGVNTITTDVDGKPLRITVKKDEYIGFWQGDNIAGRVAQRSSGTGYAGGLFTGGTMRSPLSVITDADGLAGTNRLEIGFDIIYGDLLEISSRIDDIDTVLPQYVGRLEAPITGTGLSNRAFIFPSPAVRDSVVVGFQAFSLKPGAIYAAVFEKDGSGNYKAVSKNHPINVNGGVATTLTDEQIPYIRVLQGQFLGFYNLSNAELITFVNTGSPGSGSPYLQYDSFSGDYSYLAAANVETLTTPSIMLGFTLKPYEESGLSQRVSALEFVNTYFDEIQSADITFSGLDWTANVVLARNGSGCQIVGTGTLTATTGTKTRYDLLYINADTLGIGILPGTERDNDATSFIPPRGASERIAVAHIRLKSGNAEAVPVWRARNGRDRAIIQVIDDDIRRARRLMPRTFQKIGREPIRWITMADSQTAMQSDVPPETTPNGEYRDRAKENYLLSYGTDIKDALDLYTSVELGREDDGAGEVHTKIGWNWKLIEEFEKRGYVLGSDVRWDNFGIAGYSHSDATTSAGVLQAWTTSARDYAVANGADFVLIALGMNNFDNDQLEIRANHLIQAFLDVGIEVFTMGPAQKNQFTGVLGWDYACRQLRRAAINKNVAHMCLSPLYDRRFHGALGVAPQDFCDANKISHPGLYELDRIGEEFAKFFF